MMTNKSSVQNNFNNYKLIFQYILTKFSRYKFPSFSSYKFWTKPFENSLRV